MTDDVKGVDVPAVTAWFEANIDGARGPLVFDLIAGGHSNLTYGVTDAEGHRYVLRRPPLGHVLATAHDMGREHKIISGLGPTDVPVAPALGLCADESVNGAPFYVMDFVPGLVLRDRHAVEQITPEARTNASRSIADTLARIHAVDPDAVGLGDLGKKEGYIARQLKRWYGQWEQSKTRDLPIIDEVHDALAARTPEQGPAAIVHGDYRLDNCMTDHDGNVIAVLDWEICTLGDPLADVGLLMVYWTEAGDDAVLLTAPTAAEGFLTRQQLLDRYADASGRDLSQIDFYVAFGYWKLACIVEGVYARYVGGAMGGDATGFEGFARQVEHCAQAAADAVARSRDRDAPMTLYARIDEPELSSPVLLMVLKGWIDAGMGADGAAEVLTEHLQLRTVARFDADALLDWRARRPVMRLEDGINTRLTWEETELSWARDDAGNDLLLLLGNEPDHAWLAFSEQVVDLALELGTRLVVGLGAYPAPAPHTRPPLLAASASSEELAAGLLRSSVEVPSGVQGMIERRAAVRGLAALGLWAQVPHYVAAMPYPAASLALLQGANAAAGLDLPVADLAARATANRERLDELIAQNPEHQAMLRQLEEQADEAETTARLSATSGDELAAELERFLRDQS